MLFLIESVINMIILHNITWIFSFQVIKSSIGFNLYTYYLKEPPPPQNFATN